MDGFYDLNNELYFWSKMERTQSVSSQNGIFAEQDFFGTSEQDLFAHVSEQEATNASDHLIPNLEPLRRPSLADSFPLWSEYNSSDEEKIMYRNDSPQRTESLENIAPFEKLYLLELNAGTASLSESESESESENETEVRKVPKTQRKVSPSKKKQSKLATSNQRKPRNVITPHEFSQTKRNIQKGTSEWNEAMVLEIKAFNQLCKDYKCTQTEKRILRYERRLINNARASERYRSKMRGQKLAKVAAQAVKTAGAEIAASGSAFDSVMNVLKF